MNRLSILAGLAVAASVAVAPGLAEADVPLPANQLAIKNCINAAAGAHAVPAAIIVILLDVEGGTLGGVSPNTNATVDIGPMQVNEIWVPEVAAHWHATPRETYAALRDNFCANVEAGTWILRRALDESHGSFWDGVGYYHSHNPEHSDRYLKAVLRSVRRLQAVAERRPAELAATATTAETPIPAAR